MRYLRYPTRFNPFPLIYHQSHIKNISYCIARVSLYSFQMSYHKIIIICNPYHDELKRWAFLSSFYLLLLYKDHFLESYLISLYHIEKVISGDRGSVMILCSLLHTEHKGILTMSRSNSFHL